VRPKTTDLTAFSVALTYGVITAIFALFRYTSFTLTVGDLAVYSQALWGNLHGDFMRVTLFKHAHQSAEAISFFNLHFSPVLVLVTPIFSLIPLPEGLIVLKCLLIATAGLLLYKIGKERVSPAESLVVMLLFLISPNSLSAVHDSFHLDYFGPVFFFAAFFFLTRERFLPFMIFAALFAMTKELFIPVLFTFSLWAAVSGKTKRWIWGPAILAVIYGSVAWFALERLHHHAPPAAAWDFRSALIAGLGPGSLLREFGGERLRENLWFFVKGAKFLTFFTPAFLFWVPSYVLNLGFRLGFGDHYGTLISALMFLTLPMGLQNLKRFLSRFLVSITKTLIAGLFVFGILTSFESLKILHPRHLRSNPRLASMKAALSLVGPASSVSASEIFLPSLSKRRELDSLNHEVLKSYYEYILIDLDRSDNTPAEWQVVQEYWKPFLEDSGSYERLFDRESIRLYHLKKDASRVKMTQWNPSK